MPNTDLIVWAGISGLIVAMLAIIGHLVKTGFERLTDELKQIWVKLESTSKENAEIRREIADVRAELRSIDSRCKERGEHCVTGHHHRRSSDSED